MQYNSRDAKNDDALVLCTILLSLYLARAVNTRGRHSYKNIPGLKFFSVKNYACVALELDVSRISLIYIYLLIRYLSTAYCMLLLLLQPPRCCCWRSCFISLGLVLHIRTCIPYIGYSYDNALMMRILKWSGKAGFLQNALRFNVALFQHGILFFCIKFNRYPFFCNRLQFCILKCPLLQIFYLWRFYDFKIKVYLNSQARVGISQLASICRIIAESW